MTISALMATLVAFTEKPRGRDMWRVGNWCASASEADLNAMRAEVWAVRDAHPGLRYHRGNTSTATAEDKAVDRVGHAIEAWCEERARHRYADGPPHPARSGRFVKAVFTL